MSDHDTVETLKAAARERTGAPQAPDDTLRANRRQRTIPHVLIGTLLVLSMAAYVTDSKEAKRQDTQLDAVRKLDASVDLLVQQKERGQQELLEAVRELDASVQLLKKRRGCDEKGLAFDSRNGTCVPVQEIPLQGNRSLSRKQRSSPPI